MPGATLKRLPPAGFFALGLFVVLWSLFSTPGRMLYTRYAEEWTMFNPAWALSTFFAGWSYQLHLGYANDQEPSYVGGLSLLLSGISAAFGTSWASVLYPAFITAFSYAAFVCYARSQFKTIPLALICLAGVFYAANPLSTSFVHDGYSGILFAWALLPVLLRLVDIAEAGNGSLLLAIPLVLIAGEMFLLPELLIDVIAVIVLRFGALRRTLARNRWIVPGLIAGLAVNAYWAFPLIAYLKMHAVIPKLAETQGDIATVSQYASLDNVILLRAYPENWTSVFTVPECTSCAYYSTAGFWLPMSLLAVTAFVGLIHKRQWPLLVLVVAALLLATGTHYKGSLLALPYEFVMALPIYGIFRGAGLFMCIGLFGYAIGLCAAFEALWTSPAVRSAGPEGAPG